MGKQFKQYPLAYPYASRFKFFSIVYLVVTILIAITYRLFGNDTHANLKSIFSIALLGVIQVIFSLYSVGQTFPLLPKWLYFYLQSTVFLQLIAYSRGRLMGSWFRVFVSYPSAVWQVTVIAASIFKLTLYQLKKEWFSMNVIIILAFAIAFAGLHTSLVTRDTSVSLRIGNGNNTLKIFQLTDIHLGPFMSTSRLRRISEKIVRENPDLVLLTGDYFTLESHFETSALSEGLEPLKQLSGRTFACLGNHDHENIDIVSNELKRVGVKLLVNEQAIFETNFGKIQIIGVDFAKPWKAKEYVPKVLNQLMSSDDSLVLRLILLHQPLYFQYVPQDEKCPNIVFGGHYHGGNINILGFEIGSTSVMGIVGLPDRGLFCMNEKGKIIRMNGKHKCFGKNILYSHAGTGFYGTPLRIGIPGEESLFVVHL